MALTRLEEAKKREQLGFVVVCSFMKVEGILLGKRDFFGEVYTLGFCLRPVRVSLKREKAPIHGKESPFKNGHYFPAPKKCGTPCPKKLSKGQYRLPRITNKTMFYLKLPST